MKRFRLHICFIVGLFFIFYFGGVIIEASFNIVNWEYEVRKGISLAWMVLGISISFLIELNAKKIK